MLVPQGDGLAIEVEQLAIERDLVRLARAAERIGCLRRRTAGRPRPSACGRTGRRRPTCRLRRRSRPSGRRGRSSAAARPSAAGAARRSSACGRRTSGRAAAKRAATVVVEPVGLLVRFAFDRAIDDHRRQPIGVVRVDQVLQRELHRRRILLPPQVATRGRSRGPTAGRRREIPSPEMRRRGSSSSPRSRRRPGTRARRSKPRPRCRLRGSAGAPRRSTRFQNGSGTSLATSSRQPSMPSAGRRRRRDPSSGG